MSGVYDHRLDGGDYLRAWDGEHYGDVVCWAHGPGCAMTDEVCAPLPLAGSMADECYDHLAGELLPEPMMPSVRIGAPIIAMALVGWTFVIFGALAVVKLVETFVAAVR